MPAHEGRLYEAYAIEAPGKEWKHYRIPVRGTEDGKPHDILRIGMGSTENDLVFLFRNVRLWFE